MHILARKQTPIFGSNPSRARAYGTAMPIAFATYAIAALLKKKGDGNLAFAALWAATAVHFYEAVVVLQPPIMSPRRRRGPREHRSSLSQSVFSGGRRS